MCVLSLLMRERLIFLLEEGLPGSEGTFLHTAALGCPESSTCWEDAPKGQLGTEAELRASGLAPGSERRPIHRGGRAAHCRTFMQCHLTAGT